MSTVQNHIHLSTALGTSPENAPTIKWIIHDRKKIPQVFLNLRRTKRGKLRPNILLTGSTPIQITNFQYEIRIRNDGVNTTIQNEALLLGMLGKSVYLVDSEHCDDGVDHTTYVRPMFFSEIDGLNVDHWGLEFYFVKISLEDASI